MNEIIKKIQNQFKTYQSNSLFLDPKSEKNYSYEDIYSLAKKASVLLTDMGIAKGDRLGLYFDNSIELAVLYFASLFKGITVVPMNPGLGKTEIQHIVDTVEPQEILVQEKKVSMFEKSYSGTYKTLTLDLIEATDESKASEPFAEVSDKDPMSIMFTSGTTGLPTGIEHSIESMVTNQLAYAADLEIGPEHRFYNNFSMSYMGGYHNLTFLPFMAGASVVIGEAFSARSALRFWKEIQKMEVNTLWLVPTVMSILLEVDRSKDTKDYTEKNIKFCFVGTAPLPVALRRQFEEKYAVAVYESYGLSEILFATTNMPPAFKIKDGSVGKVISGGTEVIVRDNDGKDLEVGSEGEVFIKSPHMFTRRFKSRTEIENISEEWLATGDIGRFDTDGNLFITGRKKDVIIKGGLNIGAREIESIIFQSSGVKDCAVVAIPHAIYGEDVAAVVEVKDGVNFDELQNDILVNCRASLSTSKVPASIFEIEELPKTVTGKINKAQIRDMLNQKINQ